MVKMSPEAMEQPAEAPVDTMLFSRMPPRPSAPRMPIETTAAGMAEAMVRPAKRPMYALPAPRMAASTMARMMARALICGGFGEGNALIEGSGARLKRPLEYAPGQRFRKRDDPLPRVRYCAGPSNKRSSAVVSGFRKKDSEGMSCT